MIKLNISDAWNVLTGKKEAIDLSDDKKDANTKTKVILPIIIALLICLGLWTGGMFLTHWYAIKYFNVPGENSKEALFGDSFGAVNALISAFAFAGVIVSMYLQRKDLELQRKSLDVQQEELKQNTQALNDQKAEFEIQNKTLKLQRFENTFFNMLSLQQEIVNNIKTSYNETNFSQHELQKRGLTENKEKFISGREVFEHIYDIELSPTIKREGASGCYKMFYLNLFDHYFLYTYRIIKFVDETNLLESKFEKYAYISILRSTLSRYELILLFYNELAFPYFKKLIEEYSLFDNINKRSLIATEKESIDLQLSMYDMSAFDPSIKRYNKVI